MGVTKAVARYVEDNGITIAYISRQTGLSTNILYPSLGKGRGRKLNADEFMKICGCLKIDPNQFMDDISEDEPSDG
jgi:hypothetical protein